jgi:hypothetical protein
VRLALARFGSSGQQSRLQPHLRPTWPLGQTHRQLIRGVLEQKAVSQQGSWIHDLDE